MVWKKSPRGFTVSAAGLTVGQAVAVRVTRAAQGGKGPRLSARGVEPGGPGSSVTTGARRRPLKRDPCPLTPSARRREAERLPAAQFF